MSKWRKRSKKDMEAEGFIVDTHCYPWVAYKGPRFEPTEMHYISTDEEVRLRKIRQANSRAAAERALPVQKRPTLEARVAALEATVFGEPEVT